MKTKHYLLLSICILLLFIFYKITAPLPENAQQSAIDSINAKLSAELRQAVTADRHKVLELQQKIDEDQKRIQELQQSHRTN